MRTLAMIVLVGCGGSSSSNGGVDAPPTDDGAVAASCDAPPVFADGKAPSQVLTVGPGADYPTIEAAAAVATPGTAIRLVPGTHVADQYLDRLRGTAEAPIWIGGEPNQTPRPVISGGGEAIHLSRAHYVVVHDLEITGQTANGINIDDGGDYADATAAHHVAVQRVYIHAVGGTGNQDCIKLSGVRDLFIYDSRIERCGGGLSGSGVDHVGCHRSVIARNTFDAMSGNAVQAKGGSTDIDVRQNRMRDPGERAVNLGGSTGLEFFRPPLSTTEPNAEARRVRVFANVITGATGAPFAFVGCVDCVVAHNTVVGTPRWLVRILQETTSQSGYTFEPARRGRVINNSFVFAAGSLSTHVNVGADTEPMSFMFSHNAWHAEDDPAQSSPDLPVTEDGSQIGMGSIYLGTEPDPLQPLPPPACSAGPEPGAGAPLDELPGTIEGTCHTGTPTIGAQTCP